MKDHFIIRKATENDVPTIFAFIKELAEYEKLLPEVSADEDILRKNLFEKKYAECILGWFGSEPVGFALFFHNFSTFLGKPGLYLEDLYVKRDYRGRGLGKALLKYLAKMAKERDCGRFEWSVLDWNEPSIIFYKKLGAKPMDEWTVFRLSGKALDWVAES